MRVCAKIVVSGTPKTHGFLVGKIGGLWAIGYVILAHTYPYHMTMTIMDYDNDYN